MVPWIDWAHCIYQVGLAFGFREMSKIHLRVSLLKKKKTLKNDEIVKETSAHIPVLQMVILDTLGKEELVLAFQRAVLSLFGACMCLG